ncbi:MAG: RecX family transcriptional regulator [Lachnospiraceae bacterium]|nr:RecX family transcriptional regulator [Lachnospiraceae bacterium]
MNNRIVTAIEPSPKGRGYAVYINEEFAFVLYKGELAKYGLRNKEAIDDTTYERILSETVAVRAKKRGMDLLMKTDRTEADVRRKLIEGMYPPEAVDIAIDYLRSYHYIDDMRYSCDYIRFKSARFSRRMIEKKLAEKGVSSAVIQEAFARCEEEDGICSEQSEMELIQKLVRKRHPEGIEGLDYAGRQKLYAYLYGKGFPVSAIDNICSKM